jgi:hypothetical protein
LADILEKKPDGNAENKEQISAESIRLADFSLKGSADPSAARDLDDSVNADESAGDKEGGKKKLYLFSAVNMIHDEDIKQEIFCVP